MFFQFEEKKQKLFLLSDLNYWLKINRDFLNMKKRYIPDRYSYKSFKNKIGIKTISV